MPAAPQTIDEYLAGCPPEIRQRLEAVRATLREAVPAGEERISYRMPALFRHGVVAYYAAFRHHIGLYPPTDDPALRAQAARYAGPKGNLQFPHDEPLPLALIAAIAGARLAANLGKAGTRRAAARVRRDPV